MKIGSDENGFIAGCRQERERLKRYMIRVQAKRNTASDLNSLPEPKPTQDALAAHCERIIAEYDKLLLDFGPG